MKIPLLKIDTHSGSDLGYGTIVYLELKQNLLKIGVNSHIRRIGEKFSLDRSRFVVPKANGVSNFYVGFVSKVCCDVCHISLVKLLDSVGVPLISL